MSRGYAWAWGAILFVVLAEATWTFGGRAYWRRYVIGFADVPESARRSSHFVAVAFPRLSDSGEPFTMLSGEFEQIVRQLGAQGYISIGLSDIRDFYEEGRPFPPMAVLIALDRDDPSSIALADRALRRARMKALVFVNETRYGTGNIRRHSLTRHAVLDMLRSRAWDFGWFSEKPMPPPADLPGAPVLDGAKDSGWTRDCAKYPFRFGASPLGFNGPDQKLCALRIIRARPERTPEENVRAIDANWPRRRPFFDDFKSGKLSTDWIVDYGVVSGTRDRLAVIPTPRQTGAAVFLNGTDTWSDSVIEFELKKYKSAFWLYTRYNDGHYLRVGAKKGFWKVEEKAAANRPPKTLASWPIGGLPARLTLTLKSDVAIVHINGRLAFRNALELDPRIDTGRVELIAYDTKRKNALGVIDLFRAAPLPEQWVVIDRLPEDFGPGLAERLHEQAVAAHGVSPRWFTVTAAGRLLSTGSQLQFARALSGFNRATLAPMVELPGRAPWLRDPAARARVAQEVAEAADGADISTVNLRVPAGGDAEGAMAFAAQLKARLRASGRRLWATLDGGEPPQAAWARCVDGVLKPVSRPGDDLETLQVYDMEAANAQPAGL